MNQLLEEKYKELGISEKVYAFGEKIEQELKERFEKIDANAEYNQMKVIAAMQKNREVQNVLIFRADTDIMIWEEIL